MCDCDALCETELDSDDPVVLVIPDETPLETPRLAPVPLDIPAFHPELVPSLVEVLSLTINKQNK